MKASASANPLSVLYQSLSKDKSPTIVTLYGQEAYLIKTAIELLRQKLLDPSTLDFNLQTLLGKETSASEIISAANTIPMLSKTRLVFVYDADKLSSSDLRLLIPYIERPNKSTCLCFVADSLDARLTFVQSLKKMGLFLKLDPLSGKELVAFLQSETIHLGISLKKDAVERLIEYVGTDLGQIHQELQRLTLYCKEKESISVADVDAIISSHRGHTIFELIDALSTKDKGIALSALETLRKDQEPMLRILSMITKHIRQLWQTKSLLSLNQNLSSTTLAQTLPAHPFVATKLLKQARNFSEAKVSELHEKIYHTEMAIKSSRVEDSYYVVNFILDACK